MKENHKKESGVLNVFASSTRLRFEARVKCLVQTFSSVFNERVSVTSSEVLRLFKLKCCEICLGWR